MKKNIMLVFGGKSCEHDISLISALQVAKNIDEYLYNILPVYIQKNGRMVYVKNFKNLNISQEKIDSKKQVSFVIGSNYIYKKKLCGFVKWKKIDCAVIVMHGKNGEDGSVSGLLNLCGIPYTSSDILPSAVCMDKHIFKCLLKQFDVPVVDGIEIMENDFFTNTETVIDRVEKEIGLPVIVKPCNLGSSIGIKVCCKRHELANCIEFALKFDKKVIIEEYLSNIKEINVAAMKTMDGVVLSNLEQPIAADDILSFENKYITSGEKGGDFLKKKVDPKLPKKVKTEILQIAKTVYEKLDFKGVVRFDFILDKNSNNVFLNEANSIPGSLANYLFTGEGFDFKEQLNKQILQGIIEKEKQDALINSFESNVLKGINFTKFNK